MKKIATATLLLALVCLPLRAGEAGTTGANFLKIGVGARPAAMGGAFIAVADDANAIFWNPAGLALLRGLNFASAHNEWMDNVTHDSIACSQGSPGFGTVGGSIVYLNSGTFKETLETPSGHYAGEGRDLNNMDFALSGAYAQRLGVWWDNDFLRRSLVGLKTTYITQQVGDVSASAVSSDLGCLYEVKRNEIYVGAVMQNAGTKIKGANQPLALKLGVSYKKKKLMGSADHLLVAAQTDGHILDTGLKAKLGVEYGAFTQQQGVALRAGFHPGGDLGNLANWSLGAGYLFGWGVIDTVVDYAFTPAGILGNSHRYSFHISIKGAPPHSRASLKVEDDVIQPGEKVKCKLSTYTREEIVEWKVVVRNESEEEVGRFEGTGRPPRELPWNTRGEDGRIVKGGDYSLDFTARDEDGMEAGDKKHVLLAWVKPAAEPPPPRATPEPTPELIRIEEPLSYARHCDSAFRFASDLLFERGRAILRPGTTNSLAQALETIDAAHPNSYIIIIAHTDNVPWIPIAGAQFRSNYALSVAQAQALRQFFVARGMDPNRITAMGYGEAMVIADNTTVWGQQMNRRTELLIYSQSGSMVDDHVEQGKVFLETGMALDERGEATAAKERFVAALIRLTNAAALDPSKPIIFRLAGDCYYRYGDLDQAREAYTRALQLNPEDIETRKQLELLK